MKILRRRLLLRNVLCKHFVTNFSLIYHHFMKCLSSVINPDAATTQIC